MYYINVSCLGDCCYLNSFSIKADTDKEANYIKKDIQANIHNAGWDDLFNVYIDKTQHYIEFCNM